MQFKTPRYGETWLGLIMGTATGAITVATGIFVIPGTPYIQSLQFERDKLVQALGLSFMFQPSRLRRRLRTPDRSAQRSPGRPWSHSVPRSSA